MVEFEWDEHNLGKLPKHGVTRAEAESLFFIDPLIDDSARQTGERRYRCMGISYTGRYLAAFFTMRKDQIRNISVRVMRKEERRYYEEEKSKKVDTKV